MRIAYYPTGDQSTASSRLRVWKIADALQATNEHDVLVNIGPIDARARGFVDVAVFQKRRDPVLMEMYKNMGAKVIYDVDDWLPETPPEYVDLVTVDTPAKLALFPGAVVVPDALDVESAGPRKSLHGEYLSSVVWVGNPENIVHVRNVGRACRNLGLSLTCITGAKLPQVNFDFHFQADLWELYSVDHLIVQHDLMVCPLLMDGSAGWSEQWVGSKSANKLLKGWGLGMPVIGANLQAYKDVGLVRGADTVGEWEDSLRAMHNHRIRQMDADEGWQIAQAYRADIIATQWLEVFK